MSDFKGGDGVILIADDPNNPMGQLGFGVGDKWVVVDDSPPEGYPNVVCIRHCADSGDRFASTYYAMPHDLILDEPIPQHIDGIEQWLNN